MAKKPNFRNNKSKSERLNMLRRHADGDIGSTEDIKTNSKHYDSFIDNVKKEGLEQEFIDE